MIVKSEISLERHMFQSEIYSQYFCFLYCRSRYSLSFLLCAFYNSFSFHVKWQKGGWCRIDRLRKRTSHISHMWKPEGRCYGTYTIGLFFWMNRSLSTKVRTFRLGRVCVSIKYSQRRMIAYTRNNFSSVVQTDCTTQTLLRNYTRMNVSPVSFGICLPGELTLWDICPNEGWIMARSSFSKSMHAGFHMDPNFKIHIRVARRTDKNVKWNADIM